MIDMRQLDAVMSGPKLVSVWIKNHSILPIKLSPLTIVTTLPASPYNGQEVFYQNAAMSTAGGVVWKLRYNADSSSDYKWEFVGGTWLSSETDTGETTTSTTYADLATAGPTVTTPLAGDYFVRHGANMWTNTNNAAAIMSYAVGGTAAADADMIACSGGSQPAVSSNYRVRRKNAVAASSAITAKYRVDIASTGSWRWRFIAIIPIRVG